MSAVLMWNIYLREYARLFRWLRQYMTPEYSALVASKAFADLLIYAQCTIDSPQGPLALLFHEAFVTAKGYASNRGFYLPPGALRSIPLPDELAVGQFTQTFLNLAWGYALCEVTTDEHLLIKRAFQESHLHDLRKITPNHHLHSGSELGHLLGRLVASLPYRDNALPQMRSRMQAFEVHEMRKALLWLENQRAQSVPLRNERNQQAYPSRKPRS